MVRKEAVTLLGLACAGTLALGLTACGGRDRPLSGDATGLAARESQPLVRAWARSFEHRSGARIRVRSGQFAGLGSLGGQAAPEADFALDDGSSPPREAQERLIPVPVAIAEVAVAYNVVTFSGRRIASGFQLDGHTIASIYKGPTFNWHQIVVLALNPGVEVPDELIQVCRNSGTWAPTRTFTSFLARSGPNWAHDVGIGVHVQWRHPNPSLETTDVAGCVKRNGGSIGYVNAAEARRLGLTVAAVREASGAFRLPGEPGYPIGAPLDAFVWRDPCREGRAMQAAVDVKAWLSYVLGAGQAIARREGFVPLPAIARRRARASLADMTCHGRPIAVPG